MPVLYDWSGHDLYLCPSVRLRGLRPLS